MPPEVPPTSFPVIPLLLDSGRGVGVGVGGGGEVSSLLLSSFQSRSSCFHERNAFFFSLNSLGFLEARVRGEGGRRREILPPMSFQEQLAAADYYTSFGSLLTSPLPSLRSLPCSSSPCD